MASKEIHRALSVFDQIKSGLEDSIAYSKGELSLATVGLPAPPPKGNPKKIAALRKELHMSQAVFAAVLNVSTRTVQSWEQGFRDPSDASLRLLQIIESQPLIIQSFFADAKGTAGRGRPRGAALPKSVAKKSGPRVGAKNSVE